MFLQVRLARVLKLQQQQRKRFNASQHYFAPQPTFNHNAIPVPVMNHMHDDQGNRQTLDQLLNGTQGELWRQALSNELGRLTQSNDKGIL